MAKNNKLTIDEVKHVAHLANLPLTGEEIEKFAEQLETTIEFVRHLSEIDTKNISPTSQVTGKFNEFREDKIVPGLSKEDALKNAKSTHNDLFVAKISWE